jgi:hypothetical protein
MKRPENGVSHRRMLQSWRCPLSTGMPLLTFCGVPFSPQIRFQGICLRYRVTTELRRANCFSGSNLLFAPNPLKVPINSNVDVVEAVPVNRPTRASQIQAVVRACPALALSEAKCFWNYTTGMWPRQFEMHVTNMTATAPT